MSYAIDLKRVDAATLQAAVSASVPGDAQVFDKSAGLLCIVADGPILVSTEPTQDAPVPVSSWPWSPGDRPLLIDHAGGVLSVSSLALAPVIVRVANARELAPSPPRAGGPFG